MTLPTRTILEIIQDAATELGIPVPTSVISSSDLTARQLLQFAHRTGDLMKSRYPWVQLQKEYTFTTVASQASYALPEDFDEFINSTHWDRSNQWELIGPLSPQEWQQFKSGVITTLPRRRFRIKGFADRQFFIDPTPSSVDAGETLVFEYQTQTWIRPTYWVTSTSFQVGSYCFNNGNIYQTSAGGTTGATAPTHTTGSSSDGGVTWTYVSAPYNRFLANTDVPLLDDDVLNLGIQWRWMAQKGQNYQHLVAQYEGALHRQVQKLASTRVLSLGGQNYPLFLSHLNVPDTGFGA